MLGKYFKFTLQIYEAKASLNSEERVSVCLKSLKDPQLCLFAADGFGETNFILENKKWAPEKVLLKSLNFTWRCLHELGWKPIVWILGPKESQIFEHIT